MAPRVSNPPPSCRRGWLAFLLAVQLLVPAAFAADGTALATDGAAGETAQGQPFVQVFERFLPASMPWPLDVRFEAPDSALVGAGRDGIYRLSLTDAAAPPEVVVPGKEVTFVSRLALSQNWIVAGTTFGPLGWKARGGETSAYREDVPMGVIMDLDAAGDQVWMLGARRDDAGEWAPQGAILWSADLQGDELTHLTPRLFADSGPGAREMAYCHILELGAVRNLGDGRWAVVPGVQPGAQLFDADGQLLRAWQTEPLGFTDRCDLDKEEFLRLNAEPGPRSRWLNHRRTLDDLLPWDGWPALLLRQPGEHGPSWRIVPLNESGAATALSVPVGEVGPNAHLRGDVLGDRVALLVVEYEPSPQNRAHPPRLLVLERKALLERKAPGQGASQGDDASSEKSSPAASAEIQVVLLSADGTPSRTTAPDVDPEALADARGAWVWTDGSAPRRLDGDDLTATWRKLLRDGLLPAPATLSIVLPEPRQPAAAHVVAAPAAMWAEVPEAWLPRYPVPEEGPALVPRELAVAWRARLIGVGVGTWWTDVPAGRDTLRLFPEAAGDLLFGVVDSAGGPLDAAYLTVMNDTTGAASPRVIAQQTTDDRALLHLPALPADRPATFLVGSSGFPARHLSGRPTDFPAVVRLPRGATLRGRFLDGDARPVSAARVSAEGWLADDVPVRFQRRTESADDGTWSLSGVALRPLVLTARHDGFAPFVEPRDLSADPLPDAASGSPGGPVMDLGDVVLERGAELTLAVAGSDGEPVAGASVSVRGLPSPPFATGEDGVARLTGLPTHRALDLRVTADGYLPGRLQVAAPRSEPARVALTRGFTVAGRFVDAEGLPVHAGQVRVAHDNQFHFEDLDPGGTFELLLDPALAWSLELSSPATRKRRVEIPAGRPGERRDLGDLAAPPGVTAFGTLVSAADGTPVAGARVWMPRPAATGVLVSWLYGDVAETRSDELGHFELDGLPPEPGLLRVDASGFARAEPTLQPDGDSPLIDLGMVELDEGATVVVRVEGLDDDAPSPRARLDPRREWKEIDMITAPVLDDEAELPHVPPGTSRLTVVAGPQDVLCEKDVRVDPEQERIEVTCDARRSPVAGRVLIGERAAGAGLLVWNREGGGGDADGDGVTESVIQTRLTRGGLRQQSVAGGGRPGVLVEVDDQGRFRTERLSSGRWQVSWQPISGTATAPRPVEVPAGEVADLAVRVPGLGLTGVVVDGEGNPVAQARVRETGSGAFSLSRDDGSFRLDGLVPGETRLQAQAAERYSDAVPVVLEADRVADPVRLVVSAEHEARVPVEVWDGGAPAAGAFVFLQTDRDADLRLASTGAGGSTEIVVAPPAPSRVRAAVRHEGRWAFGSWTEWRRAREGLEVEIPQPGEIVVSADDHPNALSVTTWDGWDLGRLLARLGAPPRLQPGVPLLLAGLPEGRYDLALGGGDRTALAGTSARTVVVTAGRREEVEMAGLR